MGHDSVSPLGIILPIIQEPLTKICGDTFISTAADNMTIGLSILEGSAALDKIYFNLRLRLFYRLALVVSYQHGALVVTFFIGEIFGFGKLFSVLWGIYFHFLDQIFSSTVAVGRSLDDWWYLKFCPFLLDTIVLSLFGKIHDCSEVIRTV